MKEILIPLPPNSIRKQLRDRVQFDSRTDVLITCTNKPIQPILVLAMEPDSFAGEDGEHNAVSLVMNTDDT